MDNVLVSYDLKRAFSYNRKLKTNFRKSQRKRVQIKILFLSYLKKYGWEIK